MILAAFIRYLSISVKAAITVHTVCNLTAYRVTLMLFLKVTVCNFKTPEGEINKITDIKPKLSFI